MHLRDLRFLIAWTLPLAVGVAAWRSPWMAWGAVFSYQVLLALVERVWPRWHSPAGQARAWPGFAWAVRMHVVWQAALLALALAVTQRDGASWPALLALGIGVGGVTGSQGITFAHELGHAKSRFDRALAWLLMGSVLYAHFMVEHYRGHHVRAATQDDPATARRGESLWRFLPRTLGGSFASAWRLEARQLEQRRRGWHRSVLVWASAGQLGGLMAIAHWFGSGTLVFWIAQAAYAVFLLEAINYIEHYGLSRREVNGRREAYGIGHAWNADHALTNCFIANLQRHGDHHLHAWKPYTMLEALPGPQLPTGYAGCLFLASVPRLWFRAMHPRIAAWQADHA
jgi:alkane 1-monooxygenase